jgi:hypothetical protein
MHREFPLDDLNYISLRAGRVRFAQRKSNLPADGKTKAQTLKVAGIVPTSC